jgi:hypothetical protein
LHKIRRKIKKFPEYSHIKIMAFPVKEIEVECAGADCVLSVEQAATG